MILFAANVDRLATLEQLHAVAIEYHSGATEFLERMAWLPLLADLDATARG